MVNGASKAPEVSNSTSPVDDNQAPVTTIPLAVAILEGEDAGKAPDDSEAPNKSSDSAAQAAQV
jgi:hypothetical protein